MKKMILTAPVIALSLTVTGCGAFENNADKTETKTYDRGSDANNGQELASWIPDDARDIRLLLRTTGNERILAMRNTEIPNSCTPVAAGQQPRSGDDTDSQWKADEFVTTPPTLSADWWPQGIEQKASAICGKWWVTVQDGATYAYSPERTRVVENLNIKQPTK
ncbi:hypothetical protein ODZ83_03190 [Acaricomes phytoseiuli]|uniref:hypothetical protein n=1 Tax=Acaricomes phytoseiuli TaxID=291968 RepID=UPI0003A37CFB|nr:hypothetical protein [Acaricomes phytoseiuli]MCW1249204.1 hypothetical protein [Acaricomes phytoseiuli]